MKDRIKKTHPSCGMIQVSKFFGGSSTFFGSSIKHSGGVRISIHRAEKDRHLNTDWFSTNEAITEVYMSYNQYAEMITANMNTGGTPCTIKYTEKDGRIESPDFSSKRLEFENEFKERMKELNQKVENLTKLSEEILKAKKVPSKAEKESIICELTCLRQEIKSNIPYMSSCFNETIDKTVTEAKGEIEGFYEHKIRSLGIEALEDMCKIPEIEE